MPQESHTTQEMLTIRSLMEKLMKTDTGKAGLVLVIAGIIGLIVIFSVNWMKIDPESADSRSYKYGDFGDDFKDDWGKDMDSYLHGSARLSLYGFTVLLLAGILLTLQAYNGKVYDTLSPYLPSFLKSNPRHPEFLKILLAVILFVFTLMIIISGTRFIGFVHAWEKNEALGEDTAIGSTAGWTVFILGLALLALEMYYLHSKLTGLILKDSDTYRQKVSKYVTLMTLLCLVGLIVFSLLPFVKLEVKEETKQEVIMNDGFIHIVAEYKGGDYEDVDSDLGRMRLCLWAGFVISIVTFLGIVFSYYSDEEVSGRFHYSVSFGALILIFAILFLIFHALLFSHINGLDEKNEELNYETDASFGQNYIPLLCGIGLVGLGVLYAKEAYPVSIQRIIGPKPQEKEGSDGSVGSAEEIEEENQHSVK